MGAVSTAAGGSNAPPRHLILSTGTGPGALPVLLRLLETLVLAMKVLGSFRGDLVQSYEAFRR